MSLNWNVTDVKNYKRVVYKKSETDNPDEGFDIIPIELFGQQWQLVCLQ